MKERRSGNYFRSTWGECVKSIVGGGGGVSVDVEQIFVAHDVERYRDE